MPMSRARSPIALSLWYAGAIAAALLSAAAAAGAQTLSLDAALQVPAPAESTIASRRFDGSDTTLPARPAADRDRGFAIVQASFITAASMDLSVSMYQIASGNAREGGFGAWWQDSPVAFAASKSAMAVAFAYGLERLHRTRPRLAFVLGVVATSVEGSLVVRSARMER